MVRRFLMGMVVAVVVLGIGGRGWGLTMVSKVTPEGIKGQPKELEVKTEKRADGLIHFAITLHLPPPPRQAYLVARTQMREGGKTVLDTTATSYVTDEAATFYLAVLPERVGDTKFSVFSGSYGESGGQKVPVPGGVEYEFQLSEFAKEAVEVKKE